MTIQARPRRINEMENLADNCLQEMAKPEFAADIPYSDDLLSFDKAQE